MRGPLLSGPLGSQPALEALLRWTAPAGGGADGRAPVVVLGPSWLGAALARGGRTLLLVESEQRPTALRAYRRARKETRPLDVALAAAELPFRPGTLPALVVENVAGLPPGEAERWISALTPMLRPGGRLIAADATSSDAAAARVAGSFLAAALADIVQEWPREGAVLTVGVAPAAAIVAARFNLG
ncbi:MAG TPA: hypothetical protein VN853_17330 [Polyangia bacterium]|jgi:hypothetical protein|nr:hypothetical protein [Polyangia bacterium]